MNVSKRSTDEASMIESAQSAMAELESLFDEDIDKARKMDLTDFYDALKVKQHPLIKRTMLQLTLTPKYLYILKRV
ncbi:hypothetical protein [Psychrobacter sp. WY6]|uniref:hypothetical protein n=1 Tax=Psychrobacter sp. WY6 TaxID=2708350 RepID=UPI002022D174|nr:hypothetical protein [Psychrobacter sp. WY6]